MLLSIPGANTADKHYLFCHPFSVYMSVIPDSPLLLPQLVDRVAELQAQVASARQERAEAEHHMSDHQVQLETLQRLHAQCQEEAEKLRAVLESKEEELSRILTTLQVAAAQVCVSVCVHPQFLFTQLSHSKAPLQLQSSFRT